MGSQGGSSRRSLSQMSLSMKDRKKSMEHQSSNSARKGLGPSPSSMSLTGERTVKRLRLSKALTVPDTTTIFEACQKMAARRVDALLLTDSNALLCGILTDKDIATRVIAAEINMEDTPVSKVMTKNPVFVLADTLAVEALQKMVQGKFRHLPVVENGEVIALLDIAKCLYDAIAKLERAAEKGKAIAAAVEGVEKQWGTSISGPNSFIETLRERMFRPSLSTIISENSKLVTVAPTDTVLMVAKKMLEYRSSSAVITVENKPLGILTSKDILMRVIANNLSPETCLVEKVIPMIQGKIIYLEKDVLFIGVIPITPKVMTSSPECVTVDSPIVDALHTMHEGKFLHLPVVDRDGNITAVVDVIHITHAAVATVGSAGGLNNDTAVTMMQNFWDSAMALGPVDDEEETRSEGSLKASEVETGRSIPYSSSMPNSFNFKLEDRRGRLHRFTCETKTFTDLITQIIQRVGSDIDRHNLPQILYEDEDHDKVVLASESDLIAALDHASMVGLKSLRLHLDYSGACDRRRASGAESLDYAWASAFNAVATGAALAAGIGVLAYLKKFSN